MLAMFQWLRSRIAAMVVRVVPISLEIAPSVISGWLRMIVRLLEEAKAIVGIVLAEVDLFLGKLAGTNRVAAGQLGRGGVVGDRLDLEDVKAAELGYLLEGKSGVIDQP
jgi:hypothetical protein